MVVFGSAGQRRRPRPGCRRHVRCLVGGIAAGPSSGAALRPASRGGPARPRGCTNGSLRASKPTSASSSSQRRRVNRPSTWRSCTTRAEPSRSRSRAARCCSRPTTFARTSRARRPTTAAATTPGPPAGTSLCAHGLRFVRVGVGPRPGEHGIRRRLRVPASGRPKMVGAAVPGGGPRRRRRARDRPLGARRGWRPSAHEPGRRRRRT